MAKRCYYETLGVERGASPEIIKKAYRKLAKEHHPDQNRENDQAETRFKEITNAYDILKDDQKRAAYDRFGHAAFENGGPRGNGGDGFGFSDLSDVFNDLFGMGGRRGNNRTRGADLRFNMEISLNDAYHGKQASINVPSSVSCEPCHGSGAEAGSQPTICAACNGAGKVRAQQGFFTIERTCPSCGGRGQVIKNPCKACRGAGRVQKERTLNFAVPRGVEEGTRIRLSGEGEAGVQGGPAGDLYVFISVTPHPIFQRDGNNLFCRIPISMTTAALGGEIEVPSMEGEPARITIPEGTQSGRQFRLRGKGMPPLRGAGFGDLFIETMVETPVSLTKRQKELLREFAEGGSEKTSPESSSFFARIKDLFAGTIASADKAEG
ncbi:MAG TPA: molecular chaperone DnaJ [Alphaproteobacteria bacterium]|nr:molecular chaperone DnaJ [Alphaproteobacteria bacterium]